MSTDHAPSSSSAATLQQVQLQPSSNGKMNADPAEQANASSSLPLSVHPLTLDGANDLLSPSLCAHFDPDAFLLSRRFGTRSAATTTSTPDDQAGPSSLTTSAAQSAGEDAAERNDNLIAQQDLHGILSELKTHGEQVQEELEEIINRDYRQFVGLSSEVRAESHRIQRLAWQTNKKRPPRRASRGGLAESAVEEGETDDEEERDDDDVSHLPADQAGALGASDVRSTVLAIQAELSEQEQALAAILAERRQLRAQQDHLEAVLRLEVSLNEVEKLLGASNSLAAADAGAPIGALAGLSASGRTGSASEDRSVDLYGESGDEEEEQEEIKVTARPGSKTTSPAFSRQQSDVRHSSVPLTASSSRQAEQVRPDRIARAWSKLQDLQHQTQQLGGTLSRGGAESASPTPLLPPALRTQMTSVQAEVEKQASHLLRLLLSSEAHTGSLVIATFSQRAEKTSTTLLGKIHAQLLDERASAPIEPRAQQQEWLRLCLDVLGASAKEPSEGGENAAHKLVREDAVLPRLGEIIRGPVDAPTADKKAAPSRLSAIYDAILSLVSQDLNTLLRVADCEGSTSTLSLFASCIFPAILQTLMTDLGQEIFFAGRPEAFHSNYLLSERFLDSLLSCAPTPSSRQAAEAHPSLEQFRKRWQVSVYFQMRLRQIVGFYETELADGEELLPRDDAAALMRGTEATVSAFSTPWSDDVHLDILLQREWRLCLQICSRYKTWLDQILPDLPSAKGFSTHVRSDSTGGRASGEFRGTPRTASPHPTPEDSAADDDALLRAAVIAADLIFLEQQLLLTFEEKVSPRVRSIAGDSSSEQILAELKASLERSIPLRSSIVPGLSRVIQRILAARCAEPLRMVRQISTQYRSNNARHARSSSAQIEPSSFVPQIFHPLLAFFSSSSEEQGVLGTAARRLDAETKRELLSSVVGDTLEKYAAALFSMNQTQESLRRLKRSNQALGFASSLFGSGGGSGGSGTATPDTTELDRQRIQMQADAEAVKADALAAAAAAGVSLDVEALPAWKRLLAAAAGATEE